jgi:hypothetical protein
MPQSGRRPQHARRSHWVYAVDHRVDFTLRQPIDSQGGYMRASDPGRLEVRSVRHEQQHAKRPNPVHHPTEQFQARGVSPMHILKDHEHRILPCECLDPRKQ